MTETNTDYNAIARMAYDNGVDLYSEARLLNDRKSPRAFALAVASIEELMKAQLADLVGKGVAEPEELIAEHNGNTWKILTNHKSKHRLLAVFLLHEAAKKEGREKVKEVYDKLLGTLSTETLEVKGKKEILELITSMESKRQDSLYVGVEGSRKQLKYPRKMITTKSCHELLEIVSDYLKTVERNLMISPSDYRRQMKNLDYVRPVSKEESTKA